MVPAVKASFLCADDFPFFKGLPCHLYFDLEFNKRENADRNGDEMVDLLLIVIFDALLEKYSIQGSEDFVIELDSSTEGSKFARFFLLDFV